jgi:hypothetical protein
MPRNQGGGDTLAAWMRAYDAKARKDRIVAYYLTDGNYRLACRTVRLSRRRLQITPPEGGDSIVWNREEAASSGRPVGRPRVSREVVGVAPEGLIIGMAGLAKGLMDNQGLPRPAAVRFVVDQIIWQRRLVPSERDATSSQIERVMRKLGYRR